MLPFYKKNQNRLDLDCQLGFTLTCLFLLKYKLNIYNTTHLRASDLRNVCSEHNPQTAHPTLPSDNRHPTHVQCDCGAWRSHVATILPARESVCVVQFSSIFTYNDRRQPHQHTHTTYTLKVRGLHLFVLYKTV